jgi:hypothetical protein
VSGIEKYRDHAASSVRAPQQGEPEAVFTWVTLPQGGIRLYASRSLADVAWGQRDHVTKGVLWHLDANLDQMLIVDRPTAAEALRWVLERWAREDAEAQAMSRELTVAQRKIEPAQPGRKQLD